MTVETTNLQYWMQWQVFLCAEWILLALVLASVMVLKFDLSNKVRRQGEDSTQQADASWYADESWKPCLREIHPVILLLYRVVAFCLMVTVLVADITLEGSDMFYFYTQWTFTLLTIYFGFGSLFSMYGCRISLKKLGSDNAGCLKVDDESGSSVCLANDRSQNATATNKNTERHVHEKARRWGYIFQIVFQQSCNCFNSDRF